MAVQIQLRHDTTVNWELANPILATGEMGLDTTSNLFKIRDGLTNWNDLPYGGIQGLSAYELAVQNGFIGTEEEWLNSTPISTVEGLQDVLDTKAPLTSPIFTGNLVLPNNSRINNTEHFYQTTRPATRGDNSALVIGDRWWKTDEGTEWYWNGTYWLSPPATIKTSQRQELNNTFVTPIEIATNAKYGARFLHSYRFSCRAVDFFDADNYWTVSLSSIIQTGEVRLIYTSSFKIINWTDRTEQLNLVSGYSFGDMPVSYRGTFTKIGSPSSIFHVATELILSNIFFE